jgi:hypothetical protein
MRALCCSLFFLLACYPHKKNLPPKDLPGLRVTQTELCQLSYTVVFTKDTAQVTATRQDREDQKSYTVKGFQAGASVVFTGQDLFEAPKPCQDAELRISASASPRDQISTSLALDELLYQASSVNEAQQSLWVVGREIELRMLQGAFTAIFIQEAQQKIDQVTSLISEAEALFGQPNARQLLILSPSPRSGLRQWVNSQTPDVEAQLTRSIVSLWLTSPGAISYYSLLLQARLGTLELKAFLEGVSTDKAAARFFCFDVVSRSKGTSLPKALQTLLAARQEMTEQAVSAALQISACLGDGLGVAAPAAGVLVKRGSASLADPAQLQRALGW